jgi:predicted RNA binding protein YcfA (HicA-like mRNA interferase family)
VNRRRLLRRLARGSLNVAFDDLVNLAEGLGFRLARTSGSHHIFVHPEVPQLLNLQRASSQAKPYQVRQFLRLVERYKLQLPEGEDE